MLNYLFTSMESLKTLLGILSISENLISTQPLYHHLKNHNQHQQCHHSQSLIITLCMHALRFPLACMQAEAHRLKYLYP